MEHAEKDRIASIVYTDCTLIPGANFYNAAMLAIDAMEARSKRLNEVATELLEAVQAMLEWDAREEDQAVDFRERLALCAAAFDKARAAYAKATGEIK